MATLRSRDRKAAQKAREKVKRMAATPTATTAPVAVAVEEQPKPLVLPVEVTFRRPRNLRVVLVGAGGTGARLGPDVARLLTRGDRLLIVDHDQVEERNLIRQHFIRRDIGKYKAEVVAQRAALAAGQGVEVEARVMQLDKLNDVVGELGGGNNHTIFIGAVDNRRMRQQAALFFLNNVGIWVDAGNEMRGGQVGMMGYAQASQVSNPNKGFVWPNPSTWEERLKNLTQNHEYTRERGEQLLLPMVWFNTLMEATPAILHPDEKAEAAAGPTCGLRFDTQTLAANVMAYACLINIVSRLVDGLPISTGAAFFSTQNTLSPYPFTQVEGPTPQLAEGNTRLSLILHTGKVFKEGVTLATFQQAIQSACTRGTV